MNGGVRILLARGASGCGHAAVFESGLLRIGEVRPLDGRRLSEERLQDAHDVVAAIGLGGE